MNNMKKPVSVFLSLLLCFCHLHVLQVSAAISNYGHSLRYSQDSVHPLLMELQKGEKFEIDGPGLGMACIGALTDAIPPDFCWRDVGIIPNTCPPGTTKSGLLCYPNCKEGYRIIAGVCWKFPKSYTVQTIQANCPPELVYQSGLCYPSCEAIGLKNCGVAACSTDSATCSSAIIDMVMGVLEGIGQAIELVASFGTSAVTTVATKTAVRTATDKIGLKTVKTIAQNLKKKLLGSFRTTIKESAMIKVKKMATSFVKKQGEEIAQNLAEVVAMNFCQPVVDAMISKSSASTADTTYDQLIGAVDIFNIKGSIDACKDVSKDKGVSCAQNVVQGISTIDPTGILTIAAAFIHPHCPPPPEVLSAVDYMNIAFLNRKSASIADGVYTIKSKLTGRMFDVQEGSQEDWAKLQQWSGGEVQKFFIERWYDDVYRIQAVHSGRYLDVDNGLTGDGVKLIQYNWQGGNSQRWRIMLNDDNSVTFFNMNSGRVIDIEDQSKDNGAKLHQWRWLEADSQKWILSQPISTKPPVIINSGLYAIMSVRSGKVFDVPYSSSENRAKIQQWDWNKDAENQKFYFENIDGNVFKIKAWHSGKYLDINNGGTNNADYLIQYYWNGDDNQKWKVVMGDDQNVLIYNVKSGKAVDINAQVDDQPSSNGAPLYQFYPYGATSQKWRVHSVTALPAPVVNGDYVVKNKLTNKLFDIPGGVQDDGIEVQQYESLSVNEQQKFYFERLFNDVYTIQVKSNGKYLGLPTVALDGVKIMQSSWYGGAFLGQMWRIQKNNDESITILNYGTGKAIDVVDQSTENMAKLHQWTATGGDSQKWILSDPSIAVPKAPTIVAPGFYSVKNKLTGKVFDVESGSNNDGAKVQQWDLNTQRFYFERLDGDIYRIRVKHSGKYLDVLNANTANGGNVIQSTWSGVTSQKWRLQKNGDGTITIFNVNSGRAIDVVDQLKSNGAKLHQWGATGGDSQKWSVIAG